VNVIGKGETGCICDWEGGSGGKLTLGRWILSNLCREPVNES